MPNVEDATLETGKLAFRVAVKLPLQDAGEVRRHWYDRQDADLDFLIDAQSSSLGANLASNNPFRNRAVSPLNQHPRGEAPPRPVSRNPFLDDAVFDNNGMNTKENARPEQNFRMPSPPAGRGNPLIGNAATLFVSCVPAEDTSDVYVLDVQLIATLG